MNVLHEVAQRDCRKTEFSEVWARPQGWNIHSESGCASCRGRMELDQSPEDVDLADIVNQSEQSPLYIHFTFGA